MMPHPIATRDSKDPHYSSHQCDCGCGSYVPQHLYDLGWRFLRGHKPVGAKITKPKHLGHRAPRTEPGAACNWALVETFVGADIAAKEERLGALAARIPALEAELAALRDERATLEAEVLVKREALATLLPAKKKKEEETK